MAGTGTVLDMIPIAGAALGGIYNIATAGKRAREQQQANDYERKMQMEGSKELTDYQSKANLQLWKDTNKTAQMEEIKKAGLSPGMIYGGSGPGGSTPTVSTAVPTRGTIPDANAGRANDINQMMSIAQLGLINAQTKKTEAEAENLPKTGENISADTTLKNKQVESITAGITNTQAQTKLTQAQNDITNLNEQILKGTLNEQIAIIKNQLTKSAGEAKSAMAEGHVDEKTQETKIKILNQEATNKALEAIAIQTGINLSKEKINEISNSIMQRWKELNITKDKTGYEHDDRLKAIDEYTKTTLKAAGIQAAGRLVSDVVGIATRRPPSQGGWKETHTEHPDGGVTQKYENWSNR